jgi:riboflavin kinase / FMN adenylyltransferase
LSTVTAIKNRESIDTIAIGGFDGMHIGHQHLFAKLGDNGAVVVIENGFANLTPGRERERFCKHQVFYYLLDSIRHLDGAEFIAMLQQEFPNLKRIVVGYDFHFAKDRKSSHEALKTLFKGEVIVIDEVMLHGDSVHSHKIRSRLLQGDIVGANAFLGHNYTISGARVSGQGIGHKALYATLNLEVKDYLIPKEGVYVTLTRIDDEEHFHPSVSFIGHRVTTDGSFAIESHILDGLVTCNARATISFINFIRENEKFVSLEMLKKAIEKDITLAQKELDHRLL